MLKFYCMLKFKDMSASFYEFKPVYFCIAKSYLEIFWKSYWFWLGGGWNNESTVEQNKISFI